MDSVKEFATDPCIWRRVGSAYQYMTYAVSEVARACGVGCSYCGAHLLGGAPVLRCEVGCAESSATEC